MTMDQANQLYQDGVRAYKMKNWKEALSCWQQTLSLQPDHKGALQGVDALKKMKAKHSPKAILARIKEAYAQQNYPTAHQLCSHLIKKFPENTDLQNLMRKIESRLNEDASPLEQTSILTMKAETSLSGNASASKIQEKVQQLIQQGVTLYEVQNFDQAVAVWEEALQVDPSNQQIKDYIANVRAMSQAMSVEPAKETPLPQASAEPQPSEDALAKHFDKGKALYHDKQYHEAITCWQRILEFYPNHKETLQCVEKAEKAIAEQAMLNTQMNEAEQAFAEGRFTDAERLVLALVIRAPEMERAKKLKAALDERKLQITEIRKMELEADTPQEEVASATEEEITQYFTPTAESNLKENTQAKLVISAQAIKQQKRSTKRRVLAISGVFLLVFLAAAGALLWRQRGQLLRTIQRDEPQKITIPRVIKWNSNEGRVNDFYQFAKEYAAEGDSLYAFYAYEKVLAVSDRAISDLLAKKDTAGDLNKLRDQKGEAEVAIKELPSKLAVESFDEKERDTILNRWSTVTQSPESLEEALAVLRAALSNDLINKELKFFVYECENRLGLHYAKDLQSLDKAMQHFKNAAVLIQNSDEPRGHMLVIQRFYADLIDDHSRKQWFFLHQ
jgi:tetratricopeptide (TPR) repeat protein